MRTSKVAFVAAGLMWIALDAYAELPDAPSSRLTAARKGHQAGRLLHTALNDSTAKPAPICELKSHRFFDRTNLVLGGIELAALVADGITTQHALNTTHVVYRSINGSTVPVLVRGQEANPLARPFVDAGWPGQIAQDTLLLGGELGIRYLLHRKNHHRWEQIVPIPLTVSSMVSAIHNAQYW